MPGQDGQGGPQATFLQARGNVGQGTMNHNLLPSARKLPRSQGSPVLR